MAMAMQTGMSSSKVLILVGAGLTGSIILRSGRISDVLSDLQEFMKGVNEGDSSNNHYDTALLTSQIKHLAQEIRELAISRPVTIVNGENSTGGLSSYIMPAAAVGALGYCYMWWKGWSFSDVMFVTKKNMANAVANVSKQLEHVSAALAATKRHLTQRLENLDGKLDEQQETSKSIMNEVSDVKTELSQIGFDIESLQQMLTGLEGKIGHLESKQDVTNAGIYYLCKFVDGVKDGLNVKFFQETAEKLQLPHSSVAPFSPDKSIKGLQFLMENFKDGNADSPKSNSIPQNDNQEKPALPRPICLSSMALASAVTMSKPAVGFSRPFAGPETFFQPLRVPAPAAARRRRGPQLQVRVLSSSEKQKALGGLAAAAMVAALVIPDVAEAAQPGISPSLKNFLLSIVAGGVVLGVITGAVVAVSNFDPVKRS